MNNEKSPVQSKTVWVGIITVIMSAIATLQGQEFIQDNPVAVGIFGLVVGVLTVVLRYLTNKPLKKLFKSK